MSLPAPTRPWWDAASASVPYMGMQASGDRAYLHLAPERCRLALIDAAGHGQRASDICDRIGQSGILQHHVTPHGALLALHPLLAGTVGAAALIADIHPERAGAKVCYAGVGNVRLWLGRDARTLHEGQPGLLGGRLPPRIHTREATLPPGDLLVLTTDGIRSGVSALLQRSYLSAIAMAHEAVHEHARPYDDASCIVFIHDPAGGAPSSPGEPGWPS